MIVDTNLPHVRPELIYTGSTQTKGAYQINDISSYKTLIFECTYDSSGKNLLVTGVISVESFRNTSDETRFTVIGSTGTHRFMSFYWLSDISFQLVDFYNLTLVNIYGIK